MKKNLDKLRGCLLGGAAGDALGYAVEFLSEEAIFSRYGASGIRSYHKKGGLAQISDDTQMTLFTANGLLAADARGTDYPSAIAQAYREWYKTQVQDFYRANTGSDTCWLMQVPELYAARAPGTTCMSAIYAGCHGTTDAPINHSKGCGGVMRVAPIGLYLECGPAADLLGAQAAALTHGHPLGWLPAALLVHIVGYVSQRENASLKEAVLDGMAALQALFPQTEHLPALLALMEKAIALSQEDREDLEAIHALGAGWVGDEALAIAVYCALKYEHSFGKALAAAVNHSGDSDSTGAITGNILGAHLGLAGIPAKFTNNLELTDVICRLADDLYQGISDAPDCMKQYAIGLK